MTIGIGFLCHDGIVLCADNQITWPQSHKYCECKIYPHFTDEWWMVNTFSGDPDLVKSFNGKFEDAMTRISAPYTAAKIQDVIETVLSFLDGLDSNPTDLWMLCAIVVHDKEMRLVRTTGKVVSEVSRYSYIGVGDSSLLRYLDQLFLGGHKPYAVDQAYLLSSYLVLKAKTHIEGCGGETDTFILRPDGTPESRSDDWYRTEQQLLRVESKIRTAISCFFDKRVPGAYFDKVLASFVAALGEEHQEICRRTWM